VGIIGADDDPVPNATAGMDISSIQPPLQLVGRQAAALLDRACRGQAITPHLILPPIRVMIRTSTNAFMVGDSLLRKAQAYIEEHRSGPIRVGAVVRATGTTSMTLNRHFQRHLKVSPFDYIQVRRIEFAKELLREGKLNVEGVATASGFHSSSYFCKMFRRVTNRRPGDLRGMGVSS
jgi:LacI family transcriptional regulator